MKSENATLKDFTALAIAADAKRGAVAKLFSQTELSAIPHTPENIAKAVNVIRVATEQTRIMLQMSVTQRGMYMCWLKANYTQHGEWEKFCKEQFPDLSSRTRRYWMASYLEAVGEKRPKELPAYDPDELEDQELSSSIENLDADKAKLAPRKALLEHIKKLEANRDKGIEQAQQRDERIEELEAELDRLLKSACIPANVSNEAKRIELIRNEFWRFVTFWIANLPDDSNRLKQHLALSNELTQEMAELWESHLGPQYESRAEKKDKKAK